MIDVGALQQVIDALDRSFGLEALWLFGSEARGTARADSDVDLAALFHSPGEVSAVLEARERVAELLGRPVDLVDLGRASPILGMQVLRHGKRVFEGEGRHRNAYVAGLPGRYEDVKRMRAPIEKALIARTLHGGT